MRGQRYDFSTALHAAKNGERIAREGWNGRDMWVFLHPALRPHAYMGRPYISSRVGPADVPTMGHTINIGPFLCMRAADGTFVPWLASQIDLLAVDWVVLS